MIVGAAPPPSREHVCKAAANGRGPAWPYTRNRLKTVVVSRSLHRLQRVDLQFDMDETRRLRADTGHGLEKAFRVAFAAQPFKLHPAPGRRHFVDRPREALADSGQVDQPLKTLARKDFSGILGQRAHRSGCLPVSTHAKPVRALRFKQFGRFFKTLGDLPAGKLPRIS